MISRPRLSLSLSLGLNIYPFHPIAQALVDPVEILESRGDDRLEFGESLLVLETVKDPSGS